MKGAIWSLVFLVILISASAAFMPQPGVIFGFKGASCKNGTLLFNITHEGNSVAFKDVKFVIEGGAINAKELQGDWYIADSPIKNYDFPANNYTGNDFDGKSFFRFKSKNSFYTKGRYEITLLWPSNSLYYDRVKFAVQCPGVSCNNNDQCISQQSCINQTCTWIQCSQDKFATGHTCLPKCNDYDECTNDYYVDGQCVYISVENCPKKQEVQETNLFVLIWNWLKSRYE